MKQVTRKTITEPAAGQALGRIDAAKLAATSEADIARQALADDRAAMQDAAQFARQVRQRMGLSQVELARRIDVSPETIRNWEQGKRSPTGAAKALLRLLDKAPELALQTLR
jgi:putative transcriptional regulator